MSLMKKYYLYIGVPTTAIVSWHYFYRKFNFNVPVYDVPVDLKKHVFIITGADKGIGKAAVEALAPTGARIIMACRDLNQCKPVRREIVVASKNRHVVCRECDLNSFDSIKRFAAKVIKEEPRIDVLINNAGIKYLKPRRITRDNIERQLGVNFIGPYLLTMLLLDKMKESEQARVVNVTGKAYTKGSISFDDLNSSVEYKPDTAYDQSKLALALFTKELAKELGPAGLIVNGVDPGYTNTHIERHTDAYIKLIRDATYWFLRREPRQGAFPLLYAALSLEMKGCTGKFVTSDLKVEEFDEKSTGDAIIQRKLWLTAEKWARLSEARKDVEDMVANSSYSEEMGALGTEAKSASKGEKTVMTTLPQGVKSAENRKLAVQNSLM